MTCGLFVKFQFEEKPVLQQGLTRIHSRSLVGKR